MAEVLFSIGAINTYSLYMSFSDHVKECLPLKLSIVQKDLQGMDHGFEVLT
jgi:hypothetical protein